MSRTIAHSAARASTFGAWLDLRLRDVPDELRLRVIEVVPVSVRAGSVMDAIEQLPVVATQYLRQILVDACATRESALDLLALDALVTYLVDQHLIAAPVKVDDLFVPTYG